MKGLEARLAAITALLIGASKLDNEVLGRHLKAAISISSRIMSPKEAYKAYSIGSVPSEQKTNG